MKKNKNFIKKAYVDSWNYIKESKSYIWFVLCLFVFFMIVGLVFPVFFVDAIQDIIRSLIEKTRALNSIDLIWFIFANNIGISFSALIFGVFIGIVPFVICIVNGYVLGFIINVVLSNGGILELWRLLPHGIFELIAVFISLALGIKLGTCFFHKHPGKLFIRNFILSIKAFITIVLPLLVIAAIIEGLLIYFSS